MEALIESLKRGSAILKCRLRSGFKSLPFRPLAINLPFLMYASNVSFAVIPRLSKEVEELFIKPLLERQSGERDPRLDSEEDGRAENERRADKG
jgi:hypothetical protein